MKVELRALNQIDPYQMTHFANDKKVSQYLRDSFPYPYTLEDSLAFIDFSLKNSQIDFGIVVDDICVGCIGATLKNDIYRMDCELGYWIGFDYWNKGIMSYVIPLMCQFIFENYHIHKIYAEVIAHNKASIHLLEKCGFINEGTLKEHIYKNNTFYDVVLLGLIGGLYEN